MTARAELVADRGAAATGAEFFRSRQFLDAEAATHTLRIETADGAELRAPLIVRDIPGTEAQDAISPYGYPGFFTTTDGLGTLEPSEIDWTGTGLVSVFVRHRLGASPLAGASERNVVQIADPALPPKSRPSDRRQVRRNLEAGYELSLVAGPESSGDDRAAFLDLYTQTMRRTAAAAHYFFDAAYFDHVLSADRTWLALALAPGGAPAAASIAVASDDFLHYYLSGSADTHLADSPMKNVLVLLVDHAAGLNLPLNLGGGITPGDALEDFKRGFANRTEPFLTSELICDPPTYQLLSKDKSPSAFFPLYRS